MHHYPHARLIRWDASVVVATWVLLIVAGAALLLVALVKPTAVQWAIWVLYAALGFGVLHVVLAFMHRCPVCTKRPMVQGFTPVHRDAALQSTLSGWAGVAWNVYRHRRFVCIHCGTPFTCDL